MLLMNFLYCSAIRRCELSASVSFSSFSVRHHRNTASITSSSLRKITEKLTACTLPLTAALHCFSFCMTLHIVLSLDNTASTACASRLIIGAIYTSQIASHLTATPYRRLALLIYLV